MEIASNKLRFFKTQSDFRRWLEKNHRKETELWIGFHRKDSGKGGITYHEALEEALCFGWIDGIRKRLDETSFTNRFTPRKSTSVWSNVNIAHVERLTRDGKMHPAGTAAYEAKTPARSGIYAFERETAELSAEMKKQFRKNAAAWKYFESQAPYYRKLGAWFVISAKRDDTRAKRLAMLIEASAKGQRLAQFMPETRKKKG